MDFNLNRIFENVLSILIAGGAAVAALLIAHKFFGLFAYPGISPENVDKVAKEIDTRYKIVSRAVQDDGLIRGIYDMGGVLYYYRYKPGEYYTLYPMLVETWTTERALMDNVRMITP